MNIQLSGIDKEKVMKLLEILDVNISVSELYTYYLTSIPTSIDEKKMNKYLSSLSMENSFYHSFLDVTGLKENEVRNYCKYSKLDKMHLLDINKYLNNPYYRHISTNYKNKGKWSLEYLSYRPFQGFAYKDVTVDENNYFAEITSLGFFKEPFKYLAVIQNDEIWMSITPHEIETMQQSIDEANGNVVVYGLGLGYYPYMISLKDNVKHITIVELDPNVIELFKEYILPQFEHKEKIEIVQIDALKYIEKQNSFDYAFVDLWHNEIDGLPFYLQFKNKENLFPNTKFSYWIENSLLTMLKRCLIALIEESLKGSEESDYQKESNYFDHLINKLYFIYKNKEINSYEDICNLLCKENLLELARIIEK